MRSPKKAHFEKAIEKAKPIVARVTLTRARDRADWCDGDNPVMCGRWVTELFRYNTKAEDQRLVAAVSTSLQALTEAGSGTHAEIRFVPPPGDPDPPYRKDLHVLLNGKGSLTCPGWQMVGSYYVPPREFLHERGDPIPVMDDFLPLLRRVTKSPRAKEFYVRIVSSGAL